MIVKKLIYFICLIGSLCSYNSARSSTLDDNLLRAKVVFDSIYRHYSVDKTFLLRENYPFDENYQATYLSTSPNNEKPNPYAYLWPYSGTFSAVNALYKASNDKNYKTLLDKRILPGLEEYFDCKRSPFGYASYINSATESDRFYDDNIWLGIDFADIYMQTKQRKYLNKAEIIWQFVMSGQDEKLGGGIYWCEQKKTSKNTCSNAPGTVFSLKLYMATGNKTYLEKAKKLYDWTKKNLQDKSDYLYYDNIKLDGYTENTKFSYNSGQMLQAAVLLYKLTNEPRYLTDAQNVAVGCFNYFFTTNQNVGDSKILKSDHIWFDAVMLRGFIELYHIDRNKVYLDAFQHTLDYAWENARTEKNLFEKDYRGEKKENQKWILTQMAMVEMYARMSDIK